VRQGLAEVKRKNLAESDVDQRWDCDFVAPVVVPPGGLLPPIPATGAITLQGNSQSVEATSGVITQGVAGEGEVALLECSS